MDYKSVPLRELFPPDDPGSVALIRLLLTAEDLTCLTRITVGQYREQRVVAGDSDLEKMQKLSALSYRLRMSLLHLAGLYEFLSGSPDLRRAIDALGLEKSRRKVVKLLKPLDCLISKLRNIFSGHYDNEAIKKGLSNVVDSQGDYLLGISTSEISVAEWHVNGIWTIWFAVLVGQVGADRLGNVDATKLAKVSLPLIDVQQAVCMLAHDCVIAKLERLNLGKGRLALS
jgi:hypothetical protein